MSWLDPKYHYHDSRTHDDARNLHARMRSYARKIAADAKAAQVAKEGRNVRPIKRAAA